eukprot:GABV01011179.1.p1 GENE.GABV01011179.1~~GABV01011179.1.p1  ORF type:complete len:105 (+),score=33.26 GABV01011179.1:42-356(+)
MADAQKPVDPSKLPAPANKAGGARVPAHKPHPKQDKPSAGEVAADQAASAGLDLIAAGLDKVDKGHHHKHHHDPKQAPPPKNLPKQPMKKQINQPQGHQRFGHD